MPIHIIDSHVYGAAWQSAELHAIFDEPARLQGWLDVLVALAEAQAELGIIPDTALPEIRRICRIELLDLDALQRGYAETGHSTLGLIRELKRLCQDSSGEWIYYGATVQDITDTAMALALRKVWTIVFRDLRTIEASLLELARTHRDTLMSGRTHGQPGLPITFGYKVAVWAAEARRHLERLKELEGRQGEGQLAGGVGSLAAFGEQGLELQARFLTRLGLRQPLISWTTARDNHIELLNLFAMIAALLDKIGHEVYNLQRPEIGELREGFIAGTVGSITMPHKRNPEIAEHLGTLSRLIRHHAACLAESLPHEHERDGRAWKTEWGVIGPACAMMGALLQLGMRMCDGLVADEARMLQNLHASKGYVLSEGIMMALASRVGKQTAHDLVYSATMAGVEAGLSLRETLLNQPDLAALLSAAEIDQLLDYKRQVGFCPQFVDRVIAAAAEFRQHDQPFLEHR